MYTKKPNSKREVFENFLEEKPAKWTISRKMTSPRLDRKTREEIGKNQMTALRFQAGKEQLWAGIHGFPFEGS